MWIKERNLGERADALVLNRADFSIVQLPSDANLRLPANFIKPEKSRQPERRCSNEEPSNFASIGKEKLRGLESSQISLKSQRG